VSAPSSLPRRAWTHFEPIHATVYFAPEAREQFDRVGLRGGWMGYFASRSAPMGAVSPEVIVAIFHNFHPALVRRAIPDAWQFSTPDRIIAARFAAADAALQRLWGDHVTSPDVAEAAELALQAAWHLRGDGRPLYASHAALSHPSPPHLSLWHSCTLLREHRFEGHVAALTAHGIDGIEALVIHEAAGRGIGAVAMRGFRGWSDTDWDGAEQRLRDRGILDADGQLTAAGTATYDAVEDLTDRLAAAPWEHMDEPARVRLFTLLADLVTRLVGAGGFVYPNPVGVEPPVTMG
jgi:hypothetical protein